MKRFALAVLTLGIFTVAYAEFAVKDPYGVPGIGGVDASGNYKRISVNPDGSVPTAGVSSSTGSTTVTPGTGTWNTSGNGSFVVTPGTGTWLNAGSTVTAFPNGIATVAPASTATWITIPGSTAIWVVSGNGVFQVTPGTGTWTSNVTIQGSSAPNLGLSRPLIVYQAGDQMGTSGDRTGLLLGATRATGSKVWLMLRADDHGTASEGDLNIHISTTANTFDGSNHGVWAAIDPANRVVYAIGNSSVIVSQLAASLNVFVASGNVTAGQNGAFLVNLGTGNVVYAIGQSSVQGLGSFTVTPGTGVWGVSGNGSFLVTPGTGTFPVALNGAPDLSTATVRINGAPDLSTAVVRLNGALDLSTASVRINGPVQVVPGTSTIIVTNSTNPVLIAGYYRDQTFPLGDYEGASTQLAGATTAFVTLVAAADNPGGLVLEELHGSTTLSDTQADKIWFHLWYSDAADNAQQWVKANRLALTEVGGTQMFSREFHGFVVPAGKVVRLAVSNTTAATASDISCELHYRKQ